jgi:hypothetical protein
LRSCLYRDPRGVLIHPHTREEISLGTLAVERYERPKWCFNKVLYIEKKGFFPALLDARFPERHDCALMSSEGFATGAVRDLIDLLGDHAEEVTIYCIHDADGYGTRIYQAIQEETACRPGRKIKVVNLGLEPWEAVAMAEAGLVEVETFKRGKARKPVADYVGDVWGEWLQENRVELNAMSTPQFLEWLERKFADHADKVIPPKVIPPAEVMTGRLAEGVEATVREVITKRILAEAGLDDLVARAVAALAPAVAAAGGTIAREVTRALKKHPHEPWSAPVGRIAGRIARGRA